MENAGTIELFVFAEAICTLHEGLRCCTTHLPVFDFCCRYYHHDKLQALEVVHNPDRHAEHVVDLRQLQKVEAGEMKGRKCVSLFFTAKLEKSKEAVRPICVLLALYH